MVRQGAGRPDPPVASGAVTARLEPRRTVRAGDGVAVAVYELGGSGPQPALLAHATGFCGPVLAPLARALPGRPRAVAFDERGHGRSGRPAAGDFDWRGFAADVLAVVDGMGLERPVGIGHSCGGAALLLAEEERPGTFAGLYLYEPVVYPGSPPLGVVEDNPLSRAALRRRDRFASAAEAEANFAAKPPFSALDRRVLAAYVANGFLPDGAGVRLACAREDEAQVYRMGFAHDAFAGAATVGCPVTVAFGSESDTFGPDTLGPLAAALPRGRLEMLEGLGHFGPLERPEEVAASIGRSLIPDGDPPPA